MADPMHLLLLLLLTACPPKPQDTGPVSDTSPTDADGDGWTRSDGDCDDGDPLVHPEAAERCDGVDNDCDGTTDGPDALDPSTWWADQDGDGYGEPEDSAASCAAPAGYVTPSEPDCNDADSLVHPGADERCDDTDNDCDGYVDEAQAVDARTWYADLDGDGWGDGTDGWTGCSAPEGRVDTAGDCDDGDAQANPARVEVCDGKDDDCDGLTDEADAADAPTWYKDGDGDGVGGTVDTTTACAPPDGWLAEGLDCDDSDASIHPGAPEDCDGVDQDCDGIVDEGTGSLVFYRDGDGDGYGWTAASTTACARPSGYVSDSTDCDDTDPEVHPGASETCGGGDEDCDGLAEGGSVTDLAYGDLVITEILQNPDASMDDDGEWFEVQSLADCTVDLAGLVLQDLGGTSFTVSESLAVSPGEYVVLGLCDDTSLNGGVEVDLVFSEDFRLSNGDDEIHLYAGSTLLDAVAWDGGISFPDPTGASMTLSPDSLDADENDDGSAWCQATSVLPGGDLGTPGAPNDTCDCEGSFETCNGEDDDCDGLVDEGFAVGTWYQDADADGWGSPDATATGCSMPAGYTEDATDCDDTRFSVHPGATETSNELDDDCDLLVDEGFRAVGDLVVSEIYWSQPDGWDRKYLEIYNPGSDDLHADGIAVTATASTSTERFTLGVGGLVVPAGGAAVLCFDPDALEDASGTSLCDYTYGSSVMGLEGADDTWNDGFNLYNFTPTTLTLSLAGTTLDTVIYSTGSPWPAPDGSTSIVLDVDHLTAFENDSSFAWCQATTRLYSGGSAWGYGSPGSVEDACP